MSRVVSARWSRTMRGRRRRTLGVLCASLVVVAWAVALPAGAGATKNAAEFYARGPSGKPTVSCAIYDGYAGSTEALCEYVSGQSQSKATLNAEGSVTLCRTHSITLNRCELGNAGRARPPTASTKR